MNTILATKSVLLGGLACWMTIAVINNATDPETNRHFLGAMLDMRLLEGDPNGLGQDLRWRAWQATHAPPLLWFVVMMQVLVAAYLWKATLGFFQASRQPNASRGLYLERARTTAIRALTCFMGLWLFFLVGGLWFGYWIKQGPIQQVHMTLLLLSILAVQFIANRNLEESGRG